MSTGTALSKAQRRLERLRLRRQLAEARIEPDEPAIVPARESP